MLFHNLPRDKKQLFSDNPSGNFVAIQTLKNFQRVHTDFKPKPTDIYISTYPKNGTTWTIALVDQLKQLENEKLAIPAGSTKTSCPWVDGLAKKDETWPSSLKTFEETPEPRIFKTHAAEGLIPETEACKKRLIQVMRNPLDTFVSAWHHMFGKFGYKGSFSRFFEKVVLEDGFENGSWFQYHEDFFKAKEENKLDIMFLKYEDMKVDGAKDAICKIAEFMGVDCDFDVENISNRCNFDKMKAFSNKHGFMSATTTVKEGEDLLWADVDPGSEEKPSNAHIRKGIVGDWKNYYTVDQLKQWEDYVDKACIECPGTLEFFGKDYFMGKIC